MSQMPKAAVAEELPANATAASATASATPPTSSSTSKDTFTKVDSVDSSVPSTPKSGVKTDQYPHHVIFVVHGMGRQLEEFGNYERNGEFGHLVENTKTVLQSQFHDLKTDVHIIPIEWHAKLHSMVDERMALASLRTVPKVRLVMNDYFADILYYFNNHFGSEIIRMIVDELNEAYSTFIAKHPDFNGKIAVYALSLGGVAMFDILTCMDDDNESMEEQEQKEQIDKYTTSKDTKNAKDEPSTSSQSEPTKKKPRLRKQDQPKFRAVVPKLKFRPNILFTVGSPVGAIMVMRNLEWETFHPPDDIIHHNIFHPFDPLAYRMEPLIDPIFSAIPAVTLTSTGNSQLFPISLPSLASLPSIPGSITSFWENKVSALPIPSIPTLSTLSQMTQSLKAGRWLPGGVGDRSSGASTPVVGDTHKTTDGSISNENRGESASEGQLSSVKGLQQPPDNNVSLTEAIAAATVATYLDQREGETTGPSATEPILDNNINTTTTTTTSKNVPPSPSIRPSLGPSRISSRAENEENLKPAAVARAENRSLANPINMVTESAEEELVPSTTQTVEQEGFEGISLMDMERVMGMEMGPSAAEKAQGAGAKSDVVLESVVRSLPASPESDKHAHHAHDQDIISSEDGLEGMQARHVAQEKSKHSGDSNKSRKVTIAEEGEEDPLTQKDNRGKIHVDATRSKIYVGARETNVPYRIDHVLQETTVDQYTNEYLLGMRSHFRYWGNRDIAYHILKSILQPGDTTEGGTLNLQPEMPAPVTAPKSFREAAEAKAKAAGAAYHQNQEQSHKSQDQGHKKSFSFSFSNYRNQDIGKEESNNGSSRGRSSGHYTSYGYGDDGQLYGNRYADLDMSSAANVASSSNTLFQNSPFAKKPWEQASPSLGTTGRTDSYGLGRKSESHHGAGEIRATAAEGATSPERTHVTTAGSDRQADSPSPPPRAFEEGIIVPDLTRPPKSHYRSSRVEERQNRLDS
ncbi:hypothetical protein BGX27_008952 [Mortierella sp. AM989]|nr:hypothetical protein BGX27_008952 [Mortierella sp. AM989]